MTKTFSKDVQRPSIADWAEEDRPREKLMLKGIAALSDAELVAILIGSGSSTESAVDLSKRILLGSNSNLFELGKLGVEDLIQFKGIGQAKAVTIVAAMELARRRSESQPLQLKQMDHASEVANYFYPKIGEINHEEFHALFLNRSNKILGSSLIAKGGRTAVKVDSKLIFEEALKMKATSFIIVHNHPSGTAKPSASDNELTKRIFKCGALMELPLLDHVILAGKDYYSYQKAGKLEA